MVYSKGSTEPVRYGAPIGHARDFRSRHLWVEDQGSAPSRAPSRFRRAESGAHDLGLDPLLLGRRCDTGGSTVGGRSVRQADEIVICDDGSPDDLERALGCLELASEDHPQGERRCGIGCECSRSRRDRGVRRPARPGRRFLPRRIEAIADVPRSSTDVDIIATDVLIDCDGSTVAAGFGERFELVNQRSRFFERSASAGRRSAARVSWRRRATTRASSRVTTTRATPSHLRRRIVSPRRRAVLPLASFGRKHLRRWTRERCRAHPSRAQVSRTGDLTVAEREVADSVIASMRRTIARMEARVALQEHRPDARRRAFRLLRGRGIPRATRLKCAVATVSPALARAISSGGQRSIRSGTRFPGRGWPRLE